MSYRVTPLDGGWKLQLGHGIFASAIGTSLKGFTAVVSEPLNSESDLRSESSGVRAEPSFGSSGRCSGPRPPSPGSEGRCPWVLDPLPPDQVGSPLSVLRPQHSSRACGRLPGACPILSEPLPVEPVGRAAAASQRPASGRSALPSEGSAAHPDPLPHTGSAAPGGRRRGLFARPLCIQSQVCLCLSLAQEAPTTRCTSRATRCRISAWRWSGTSACCPARTPRSSATPRSPAASSTCRMCFTR